MIKHTISNFLVIFPLTASLYITVRGLISVWNDHPTLYQAMLVTTILIIGSALLPEPNENEIDN